MLHEKHNAENSNLDDIYASTDLSASMPKCKIPDGESDPRKVCRLILDELMLDGNSRQNLATFCSTWVEPEVREIMSACLDKNMIDKDEYPQTAEIESCCVHMLADLWHSPHAANTMGCSTTGSSEAAMLAGMALKARWRAARRAQGRSVEKPNLVTGPVQVCWHKFCRYWDVELREAPMEPGRYVMARQRQPPAATRTPLASSPLWARHLRGITSPSRKSATHWTDSSRTTDLIFPCTSMRQAADSWPHSFSQSWHGISACPASSRSTRQGTSLAWHPWASVG